MSMSMSSDAISVTLDAWLWSVEVRDSRPVPAPQPPTEGPEVSPSFLVRCGVSGIPGDCLIQCKDSNGVKHKNYIDCNFT